MRGGGGGGGTRIFFFFFKIFLIPAVTWSLKGVHSAVTLKATVFTEGLVAEMRKTFGRN